jgi:hypothetical protein
MARVEIEEFSGKDISRLFVAGSIREAERAEVLLSENAISYAVEIEDFINPGFFSSSIKKGVVFYVLSGQYDFCRSVLLTNGLKSGLVDNKD